MILKSFPPLFPTAEIKYTSKLTEEEIFKRLQNAIGPEQQFVSIFSSPSKPYSGKVKWNNTFELKPTSSARSIMPFIEGSFESNENETVIIVNIAADALALGFMKFFLIAAMPIMIIELYLTGEKFNPTLLLFIPFFACGIVFQIILYRSNLKDCIKNLSKLFDAQPAQPTF